jgi:small subunit ribosomal protein S20
MPITRAAKRALKKSLKKKDHNFAKKGILKKAEKKFVKSLTASDIEEAKKDLRILYKLLDKAVKTNLIKKNKAARDKSRLAKKVNELQAKKA